MNDVLRSYKNCGYFPQEGDLIRSDFEIHFDPLDELRFPMPSNFAMRVMYSARCNLEHKLIRVNKDLCLSFDSIRLVVAANGNIRP